MWNVWTVLERSYNLSERREPNTHYSLESETFLNALSGCHAEEDAGGPLKMEVKCLSPEEKVWKQLACLIQYRWLISTFVHSLYYARSAVF